MYDLGFAGNILDSVSSSDGFNTYLFISFNDEGTIKNYFVTINWSYESDQIIKTLVQQASSSV